MEVINSIFDHLSEWRHLPDYQLERRADIFFACYLHDILGEGNHNIHKTIIPEFPMRIGTLYDGDKRCNLSYKIDYLAATKDLTKVFFIELKTDTKSIDKEQYQNMIVAASKECGMKKLIDGILTIFRETNEKRKYYYLIQTIAQLGLINIPDDIQNIMRNKKIIGINQLLRTANNMDIDNWYIAHKLASYEICYILPRKSEKLTAIGSQIRQITFDDCIRVTKREKDQFSQRFTRALEQWLTENDMY